MDRIHRLVAALFLAFASSALLFAEGSLTAMKVRANVDIPDGECLRYGIYTGGVKSADFYMVTRYLSGGKVEAFMQMQKTNSATPLPAHYREYSMYAIVNLETASMVKYVDDEEDYYVRQNKATGPFFFEVNYGAEIDAIEKIWDGYSVREKKIRVRKVDANIPLWDQTGFLLWGGRLLDWESGRGIVNIWAPMFKDPIPGTLFKIKDEKIDLPIGEIEATKVGWKVADPFLGALIRQFTDSQTFDIEKAPAKRCLALFDQSSGQTWKLESATIVGD
ncbi:MAG TPA: hypothetical protein VMV83_02595 [Rectinemataceae bacterium]|nr:hypothetical protein [Rectinemataceae bacterium]